jgi:hypothetical protein
MTATSHALLLLINSVIAPCPAPKDEPIKVVVLVILGTDKNNDVNERLKEIAPKLQEKDKTLTGFELHKVVDHSIKMGDSKQIDLCTKMKLSVTVNEKTDDAGHVTLTIKLPKLDEITYDCTCGKFFPILTNCYTPDNKRLIVAIMAKPCKKKK